MKKHSVAVLYFFLIACSHEHDQFASSLDESHSPQDAACAVSISPLAPAARKALSAGESGRAEILLVTSTGEDASSYQFSDGSIISNLIDQINCLLNPFGKEVTQDEKGNTDVGIVINVVSSDYDDGSFEAYDNVSFDYPVRVGMPPQAKCEKVPDDHCTNEDYYFDHTRPDHVKSYLYLSTGVEGWYRSCLLTFWFRDGTVMFSKIEYEHIVHAPLSLNANFLTECLSFYFVGPDAGESLGVLSSLD